MRQQIDPRRVVVGIEVDGRLKRFEGMNVTATGTKFANPLQNECALTIDNLARETRDYLLTTVSPFNGKPGRKLLTLEAGRESWGTFAIFSGDITNATITQPPDIGMTLKARTGAASKGVLLARAHPTTTLSAIAKGIAKDLNLALVFEAADKNIRNYSFSGAALQQVERLSEAGSVNAFVDDDRLVVKNRDEPLQHTTHVLSEDSGMIGVPEITERGVKVTLLLTPGVRLGGRLTLSSRMNPALAGDYVIYKLEFNISSRDTPFYWIAECKGIR
ncbi:MAG: hypothetical protein LBJ59_02695 [Zoogloeaceae bacterium]|jgi:hypothetical protein|nr:hypothetical protein [Zoogloeaceae bacterium]